MLNSSILKRLRSTIDHIINVFHGLALLRHSETIHFLGAKRLKIMQIEEIRREYTTAKLADDLIIMAFQKDRIHLGRNVTLVGGTVLTFGDPNNGFGNISIDDSSWIGQYNNFRACGGGDIRIGRNCLVSQFCSLIGSNHGIERSMPIIEQEPDRTRLGVTLEDDVWLGAGVIVMPGVTICRGGVIGANAVVTRDVPEFEVWAGVPAAKIGERK